MKQAITTRQAPEPAGPYSQAIIANGWIYVSGQGPTNPETGSAPEGVTAQTHQVLTNIRTILREAGADMSDVVKVTAYLADIADFAAYNAVYKEYFPAPYPARTTVGAALRDIAVEIDVVAVQGESPGK